MKTFLLILAIFSRLTAATPTTLGPLQIPNNFDCTISSTTGSVDSAQGFINYHIKLNNQTHNIYLTSNHSPTNTYGLITYIDAMDTGTMPATYQCLLDKDGLIFLAGTGIPNTLDRTTRAGMRVKLSE